MSMRDFLANPDWDAPFFKRLAHNDTGQAAGHQGGMVLPKELRRFLPSLDEAATSQIAPTTDRDLRAEMFVGTVRLTDSVVRYQFQTWGGTRSAESRITDGFAPLRNKAAEGDLLLFQRRADAVDCFRLVLVKQGTPEYQEVNQWVNGRRWGALFVTDLPVTQNQLTQACTEITRLAERPFEVVKPEVTRVETRQSRIARGSAFRESVRAEYMHRCAISGIDIATPSALYEVESAHVVPLSEGGSDDIRNGFALSQTIHWAFDRGLVGVLPNRTIYIPRLVKSMAENAFLKQFEKKPISEAKTRGLRVHADAFTWHYDNKVRQWD
ncbi:MAG: HNH endonuclease [Verrucomicrobiae bacterium]|nr:HNH endonuclease [Verrucomicrobiae bacterium]